MGLPTRIRRPVSCLWSGRKADCRSPVRHAKVAGAIRGSRRMHPIFAAPGAAAVPIRCVTAATWPAIRDGLDASARAFADTAGFEPRAGRHLLLPAPDGSLSGVLFGIDAEDKPARDPFA